MKVLVQSDDYGFTWGVVAGMCDAFARGIITSTGLFANMPIAEYAVEQVKKYPHICLGIDINVSSGPSVADPKLLPTLADQRTGQFIQTSERQKDPRWRENVDLFKPYEEVVIEARAQVEKYIALMGHKPEYLHSHSRSGSRNYMRAIMDVAHEYGIPFSEEVFAKYHIKSTIPHMTGDPWSFENQTADKVKLTLEALEENKDEEYILLGSHCGFVDAELMSLTRCNIARSYDHAYLTSPLVKGWLEEHGAQLISYRDLPM